MKLALVFIEKGMFSTIDVGSSGAHQQEILHNLLLVGFLVRCTFIFFKQNPRANLTAHTAHRL